MQELYLKLKDFHLEDIIKLEETDRQFIALQKLYLNLWKENIWLYLSFIIANSIISYQLSSTWEKYWEEFIDSLIYFFWSKKSLSSNKKIINKYILKFFESFLSNSKWNKRFVLVKKKRINKLLAFLEIFFWKEEYYYNNILLFRNHLAKIMNQKITEKTIVFSVKMFHYWARNIFMFKVFPKDICIPIDSRLTFLFDKYKWEEYTNINKFYLDLANKLSIPELHLDALVWINYKDLIL